MTTGPDDNTAVRNRAALIYAVAHEGDGVDDCPGCPLRLLAGRDVPELLDDLEQLRREAVRQVTELAAVEIWLAQTTGPERDELARRLEYVRSKVDNPTGKPIS